MLARKVGASRRPDSAPRSYLDANLKWLTRKVCGRIVKHFRSSPAEQKGTTDSRRSNCDDDVSHRSLVQAFTTIATQTNAESEAHQLLAGTLLNKVSTPMKNLADTQAKARKPVKTIVFLSGEGEQVSRFRSKTRSVPSFAPGEISVTSTTK